VNQDQKTSHLNSDVHQSLDLLHSGGFDRDQERVAQSGSNEAIEGIESRHSAENLVEGFDDGFSHCECSVVQMQLQVETKLERRVIPECQAVMEKRVTQKTNDHHRNSCLRQNFGLQQRVGRVAAKKRYLLVWMFHGEQVSLVGNSPQQIAVRQS